ncbi:uncharacterized protein A1O9_10273 [Exophiala aquamarina CBS 119918]|uniref:Carboxymuconolactone decarboxylase-like domain-containing protein n=1 Tax=Exophiala aquamarina CBS 119918 TaxID=1182545 RepID=A0A072P210_9EURO|nr:uncharacterized protein A1O9_10273 [Exophiala aquamarina CBS 119918]KEF53871.1 hypothetical protein A1O9_10273 [Exophiala aquamarina CBS 119918]
MSGMERLSHPARAISEFAHITANNRPGTPLYDATTVTGILQGMVDQAPELKDIAAPILASICIGAHRADIVPYLLDLKITAHPDPSENSQLSTVIARFSDVIMTVWPFVGIPWIVPAVLGIGKCLYDKGIEDSAGFAKSRGPLSPDVHNTLGRATNKRTYSKVNNPEVGATISTYFPEFSNTIVTVIFGYSMGGTTMCGRYEDFETQLLVMSAISASGATRQAISHTKASLGMGNRIEVVEAVVNAIRKFTTWNGEPVAKVDVRELAREVASS